MLALSFITEIQEKEMKYKSESIHTLSDFSEDEKEKESAQLLFMKL